MNSKRKYWLLALLSLLLIFSGAGVSYAQTESNQDLWPEYSWELGGDYCRLYWINGLTWTIIPEEGYDSRVIPGEDFCFSLEQLVPQNMVVYANSSLLQPDENGIYRLENVQGDMWLIALPEYWSILRSPVFVATLGGGVANPSGLQLAAKGDSLSISFRPDEGKELTMLMVDGNGVELQDEYVLNVTKNYHIVLAMFSDKGDPLDQVIEPFTDVNRLHWFYDPVRYVYYNELMQGISPTTFDPYGYMTRAMLATVIYRHAGSPEIAPWSSFTDVAADSWYGDAVAWGSAEGLLLGMGNGKYSPDTLVSREQLAAILYRYVQQEGYTLVVGDGLQGYKDGDKVSPYAYAAVNWAVAAGVLQGDNMGYLRPQNGAARAEVAAMLYRLDMHLAELQ